MLMTEIENYVQAARDRMQRALWTGGQPQLIGAIEMLIEAKVESVLMRMSDDERAIRRLLPQVRAIAQETGLQHAAWDLIFDAEAFINWKPTVLKFESREKGMEVLRGMLESYAPKDSFPAPLRARLP
jgi:hypothetical protein